MSWLEKLKELKATKQVSSKQIADGTFQPERTVSRIFSGETENPTITVLIPIINFLGGDWDEIFADTTAVVGNKSFAALQDKVSKVTAENNDLKEKVEVLTDENKRLTTQLLEHKDELLALHRQLYKLNSLK